MHSSSIRLAHRQVHTYIGQQPHLFLPHTSSTLTCRYTHTCTYTYYQHKHVHTYPTHINMHTCNTIPLHTSMDIHASNTQGVSQSRVSQPVFLTICSADHSPLQTTVNWEAQGLMPQSLQSHGTTFASQHSCPVYQPRDSNMLKNENRIIKQLAKLNGWQFQ